MEQEQERSITTRPRSHGHDFVDALQKEWGKKGTASYPLFFCDAENDMEYKLQGQIKTINGCTVVYLEIAE